MNKLKNEIWRILKWIILKDEKWKRYLGFQESYSPIGLHVDGGFKEINQYINKL